MGIKVKAQAIFHYVKKIQKVLNMNNYCLLLGTRQQRWDEFFAPFSQGRNSPSAPPFATLHT